MHANTTNPVVRALRPEPHRGDQVAAGVVVLATLMLLVQVRFADEWGDGARFVVGALAAGFVGAMAYLSPLESDRPRSYQSVLYVTTCLLTLLALLPLAAWWGASDATSPGALAWVMFLVGVLALTFSLGRNSSYCTLVAALAFMLCLQGTVQWLFEPDGLGTARWVFVLVVLADLLGAVMLRDRRRRHAVMLADAAGVAVLLLASTLLLGSVLLVPTELDDVRRGFSGVGWGWALFGFAAGFGLIAYAGADREPGPGYLGVACLIVYAVIVGGRGEATLLGWPLVLAVVAGVFLVLGLRPSHPLPPEPIEDVGEEPRAEPLPTPPDRRPGALWQRIRPEPVVEPDVEAGPGAGPGPVPSPEPRTTPQPVVVVEPAPEPEPEPAVLVEPEPVPEPASEPEPVVEPVVEPEPAAEPEPVIEPEPVVEPEPAPEDAPTQVVDMSPATPESDEPGSAFDEADVNQPTQPLPPLRPLPPPGHGTPRLAPHPDADNESTGVYPTRDDEDEL